ncbi:hypothetical protein DSLPV1_167 [Dishui lake phycodnavirus 1]|uniref:hypothetical protein n=1 Tax=Dishui lake phycodnavirus 1 TaxID=2079134 RepID=UPI000CD693D5|nr:hypothetical protein C5Y57_gp167 [Dishui lake phycodnavirus 1]AUT19138.1 hypothetical protein DSLPV1_167 [Dishui lake phycodnavirus 1]
MQYITTVHMPTLDLDALCNPRETDWYAFAPQPIYRFDDYIALYERHCRAAGLEFDPDRFDPKVYKYEPAPPTVALTKFTCESSYGDTIRVKLEVDEAAEKVSIVINTVLKDLFEKYWSQGVQPPLNDLVVAFKKLGADDGFLKKIIQKHDKIQSVCKNFDIDKAFKPKSKPKKSKSKKEEEPVEEEEEIEPAEDAEREEAEEEEEFEGMDVEEVEDDEDGNNEDFEEELDMDED